MVLLLGLARCVRCKLQGIQGLAEPLVKVRYEGSRYADVVIKAETYSSRDCESGSTSM